MPRCLFVADLHGDPGRYRRLFEVLVDEAPDALFMGGDLLPSAFRSGYTPDDVQSVFVEEVLAAGLSRVHALLGDRAPEVFLVPGNDDCRTVEPRLREGGGLWEFAHGRRLSLGSVPVYGYAYVPPTPFRLKDWERYDVSRYVDPGCTAPDEGLLTVAVEERDLQWSTIREDLERLTAGHELADAVFLFHAPPHNTPLDRAALDGMRVDHVPLDVHVGSIAIRRFIEARQPRVTLHGHVHESARLTGAWRTQLGGTHCLSAAHDGRELALVRFDPDDPAAATRDLLPVS
jgi:Icc-related predicted phosphoesterase